jgi:undecaprenyl-diphosphatase
LFVCWPYLEASPNQRRNREVVWATVAASFVTMATGIVLGKVLPFRLRPIDNAALGFVRPAGQQPIQNWPSAFPSDHAVLFFGLAIGGWFISRRLGAAALAFALLFIGIPRIYTGYHHPTDILAGAGLGIAGGVLANQASVRRWVTAIPMRIDDRYPGLAGSVLFFILIQVATVFWEPRFVLAMIAKAFGLQILVDY